MNYDKIKKILELDEGRKKFPYKCTAGKLTIGIGRNIEDIGLSDDEIDYLFQNDVKRCERDLQYYLPWYENQPEVVQFVLVDMCFMGIGKLLGFKKTLSLIEGGKYKEASIEMLNSLWAKQVGDRAVRLSKMLANERLI